MTSLTKISFLFTVCCSLIAATTLSAQETKEPAAKKSDTLKATDTKKEAPKVVKTASGLELKSNGDKASYGLGMNIANGFKKDGVDINMTALIEGLKIAIKKDGKPVLTDEEVQQAFKEFSAELRAKRAAKQLADAKERGAKNAKYLEENKKKKGVTVTKSGLQYEVMKKGNGATPTLKDSVVAHYHGTLTDGTVFDSSVKRGQPATFPVSGVIPGWTEVLQLMKEGDKFKIVLPSALAYGERGTRGIPANSVLVFEVELVKVNKAGKPNPKTQEDMLKKKIEALIKKKAEEDRKKAQSNDEQKTDPNAKKE